MWSISRPHQAPSDTHQVAPPHLTPPQPTSPHGTPSIRFAEFNVAFPPISGIKLCKTYTAPAEHVRRSHDSTPAPAPSPHNPSPPHPPPPHPPPPPPFFSA